MQTVCEAEAWTASYLDVSCGCTRHSDGWALEAAAKARSPGLMSAVPLLPRRLRGAAPSPLSVTLPVRLSQAKAHGVCEHRTSHFVACCSLQTKAAGREGLSPALSQGT